MAEPYTESQAIETQGTRIFWYNLHIGEVISFTGPGGIAPTYPVTNLQSTSVEKRMGLRDEGDYSMECNYLSEDPGQLQLIADRATRTPRWLRIIYSNGYAEEIMAYCTGAVKSGGVDNKVNITYTLATTGDLIPIEESS